jgi:hypothetical protein
MTYPKIPPPRFVYELVRKVFNQHASCSKKVHRHIMFFGFEYLSAKYSVDDAMALGKITAASRCPSFMT